MTEHLEAFCFVVYRSVDGAAGESIWNSRDGVVPSAVQLEDGRPGLRAFGEVLAAPADYVPPVGVRVIVDMNAEKAARTAHEFVHINWEVLAYEPYYLGNPRLGARRLWRDWMDLRPYPPDVVVVNEVLHDEFAARLRGALR